MIYIYIIYDGKHERRHIAYTQLKSQYHKSDDELLLNEYSYFGRDYISSKYTLFLSINRDGNK